MQETTLRRAVKMTAAAGSLAASGAVADDGVKAHAEQRKTPIKNKMA